MKHKRQTKRQIILDFIEYFGSKPFTYQDVVKETGVAYKIVKTYLYRFRRQGLIKYVQRGIGGRISTFRKS